MTLVESKLKDGTLTLGPTATPELVLSCQVINVTLTPKSEQKGNPIETLCGDVATAQQSSTWSLKFTGVQDWSLDAKTSFVNYAFDNDGQTKAFEFAPQADKGPKWTGTLTVMAVEIGGEVNTRITTDGEWFIATIKRTDAAKPDAKASDSSGQPAA